LASLGQPVDVIVDADDRVVVAAALASPIGAEGSVIKVGAVAAGSAGSSLPDLLMHAGGTAWFPSLAVGPSGRIVAAWSELSGEGNDAYVAELDEAGSDRPAWRPLGHALDNEPLADATRPSLAVGAGGTLFVVWHEQHGRRSRYHLARWSGSTWEIVGGEDVGVGDAIGAGRPRLAVLGDLPLVVWHDGEPGQIRLARYNGRAEPLFGLEAPIGPSPCRFDPSSSTTLSSTGCFSMQGGMPEPAAGLIPIELNTPLWSDGASKRRWIVLPSGTQIVANPTGAWTLPAGAMVVKEFSLDMTAGDPTSRRPVETRFLLWNGSEVQGYSLQWDDAGTDATLLPGDAPVTREWFIDGAGAHTHFYPSRAQCTTCHNAVAGFFLGLQTGNVNRNVDYDGVTDNALRAMTHAGILEAASGNAPARFAPPHDFTATPYDRVRSYLTANCSQCHRPGGLRPTRDFRWETPLAETHICDGEVVLGDPDNSLIYQRLSTRPGMPPLATLIPDPFALSMFREWIAGMTSCP
jgi:hypothetical protein